MPNRIIKETIKSSPQIDKLTWFEEVLFYRLMVTADDFGCVDGRIILLKNELFPTKENVSKRQIEEALKKLDAVGLIKRYSVDSHPYLCFPTWEKHQRIRNKHRKFPSPGDADECQTDDGHLTDICQSNDSQVSATCQSESNPNRIQYESNQNPRLPPSYDEIAAYCKERNSPVDPKAFYDYFTAGDWKDSKGNKVKNWKQKIITWEKNATPSKRMTSSYTHDDLPSAEEAERMEAILGRMG